MFSSFSVRKTVYKNCGGKTSKAFDKAMDAASEALGALDETLNESLEVFDEIFADGVPRIETDDVVVTVNGKVVDIKGAVDSIKVNGKEIKL